MPEYFFKTTILHAIEADSESEARDMIESDIFCSEAFSDFDAIETELMLVDGEQEDARE